jgi:hypothetical protein
LRENCLMMMMVQDGSTKYYCQKNTCMEKDSRGAKQDQHDLNINFNAAPDVRCFVLKILCLF